MGNFSFQKTSIPGLIEINPFMVVDKRGYFSKFFEKTIFEENGIPFEVVEELASMSVKGTLRGLHFQNCHSQDKLVRVSQGAVYDVVVDLRRDSPTFGKWQGFELTEENRTMLYIPKNFAHGFLTLSETAVMHYFCGDRYDAQSETGIIWNDVDLKIAWPLDKIETILISERDKQFPSFQQFIQINNKKSNT